MRGVGRTESEGVSSERRANEWRALKRRSINLVKNFLDVTEKVGKSTKNSDLKVTSRFKNSANTKPLLFYIVTFECKCQLLFRK